MRPLPAEAQQSSCRCINAQCSTCSFNQSVQISFTVHTACATPLAGVSLMFMARLLSCLLTTMFADCVCAAKPHGILRCATLSLLS
jgi:hypothetical protein